MADGSITRVPGVQVGHHTDLDAMTGVTVMTFGEPNVAVVDVRGGAPGSRELGLFGDAIKPITVNALVFAGGSAFGLASADGVMSEIEKEGRGQPTPTGPVPIVPAAIIYDLIVGRSDVRPTPEDGRRAYRARSSDAVVTGSVGAGTGATVGKISGFERMTKSGVGSASTNVGGATVGALVVLNAVGNVFDLSGSPLSGATEGGPAASTEAFGSNTTLMAVATDAAVDDRNELRRLAVRAHDALAATVRPAHTRYDGDTAFIVSSGQSEVDVDQLGEATFEVVAAAIVDAVTAAAS